MKEPKVPIVTDLDEQTFARLTAIAEDQGISIEALIEQAVERGMPRVEAEVLGPQFVGGVHE